MAETSTYGDVQYVDVYVDARGSGIAPTGDITITGAGKSQTKSLSNGHIQFSILDLSATDYTLSATYGGDNNYNSNNAKSDFTVNKATSVVKAVANPITYGSNAKIVSSLSGTPTGNVVINIKSDKFSQDYEASIDDGKAILTVPDLNAGDYTVTVNYNGDGNYTKSTQYATSLKVNQAETSIKLSTSNIVYGDNLKVVSTLTGTPSGDVVVTVKSNTFNQQYSKSINDGKATLYIPDLNSKSIIKTFKIM